MIVSYYSFDTKLHQQNTGIVDFCAWNCDSN